MTESLDVFMNCPVCLENMKPPIRQCEEGHSTCGSCIETNNLTKCPLCRANMTTIRNYQLEDLISSLKDVTLTIACQFTKRGCKYILKKDEQETHHLECRHRDFHCEGKEFCGWDCEWTGKFEEIIHHFKIVHKNTLEFKTEDCMRIDVTQDSTNVQAVDYQNGQQIFWFKNVIDVKEEKVYWLFQYVGLKKQTIQYYYEFEIHKGPIRKLKFTEICEWDGTDTRTICNEEKCVAVSFKAIKNFLNEKGEIAFRFRIMKVKKESDTTPNVPHLSMKKSSSVPLCVIPPKNQLFQVSAASYQPVYCHPLFPPPSNQLKTAQPPHPSPLVQSSGTTGATAPNVSYNNRSKQNHPGMVAAASGHNLVYSRYPHLPHPINQVLMTSQVQQNQPVPPVKSFCVYNKSVGSDTKKKHK